MVVDQGQGSPARPYNRVVSAVGYLMFGAVAARELAARWETDYLLPCALLLAALLLLFATGPLLFQRYPRLPLLYLPVVTALIQALGLLPPYQDIWGLLYVIAGVQAYLYLPPRAARLWAGGSAALMLVSFVITHDPMVGLGHALTYLAGAVLVVSWEALSGQARAARAASEALLADLQNTQQRLQAYADAIEELATLRERDRMAHQLHDSVGQMLFSITLTAESARLLQQRDPERVSQELERLEQLTAGALRQMRSLITEWRPG